MKQRRNEKRERTDNLYSLLPVTKQQKYCLCNRRSAKEEYGSKEISQRDDVNKEND